MKAIITVTRETVYSSIVEMTEEEFAKFNAMLEGPRSEERIARGALNEKINSREDWQSDELTSLDEFERYTEYGELEEA